MKTLKPMRWKEGMFLRPQHFQQYDLYLESREVSRFQALESCDWGLLGCEIDSDSLNNFVFKLDAFSAVLPGGTLVDVPENAAVASRPFETHMTEVGRPLDVKIGVRGSEGRGPQTRAEGEATGDTRYLAAEQEVYDIDAGRDPVPQERLVYNLRLFFGDEPTDGYEAIPLARLVRTGDIGNPVKHDPAFSPPALIVAASPVLMEAARAVVERLTLVLRDLAQQRGGHDPEPLILYYGLSGSLPVLKEMVQDGTVHPRRLYHELVRLAGALYYREKEGRSAEEIPNFDHAAPAPIFTHLRDLIVELSEIVIVQSWRRCPFAKQGDQFLVALPGDAKTAGAQFYLELEAEDSVQKVPMLIMAAKSSNPSRIDTLRAHALPGVPTEAQPGPPPQLPPGQTAKYFRLRHEDPRNEWSTHVLPSGELVVFIMNAPEDIKMNLIVTLPG